MVDSTKCPVCGRKGIPDYQNDDVRCPDCGSNLKVFRILDSIEQDAKAKTKKMMSDTSHRKCVTKQDRICIKVMRVHQLYAHFNDAKLEKKL